MFKNRNVHVHLSDVKIGNNIIERVGDSCKEKSFRCLGHWADENLTWKHHLDKLQGKLISANYALSIAKYSVPLRIRKTIYRSLFESHLHFGSIIYGSCDPRMLNNIINIQKHAVQSIACAKFAAHTDPLFKSFNILKVTNIISLNQCTFVHKFRAKRLPKTFDNFFEQIPLRSSSGILNSDYNYKHKNINHNYLFYLPHYQLVQSWNCTNMFIKCQGEENEFK